MRKQFTLEIINSIRGGDRERMTANHESYLLMAGTQHDMEDWVKSIRRVIWGPFGGDKYIHITCFNDWNI
ncbi:Rho GTPase-activating protein 24 [Myotis brandtii]|uniref:Rho GTPase-activating protein 24 n=1 Tax=Myotis brandtii TaxID=109478 RepID=S7N608_MYOBR|nr:Rho GTPase-activating protein 24 [Myotis brandtii]